MSEIFMEKEITGISYPRCLRIEIQNTKDGLPTVQFVTEEVLEIGDSKIYSGCKVDNIVIDPTNVKHLEVMQDLIAIWQELQIPVIDTGNPQ